MSLPILPCCSASPHTYCGLICNKGICGVGHRVGRSLSENSEAVWAYARVRGLPLALTFRAMKAVSRFSLLRFARGSLSVCFLLYAGAFLLLCFFFLHRSRATAGIGVALFCPTIAYLCIRCVVLHTFICKPYVILRRVQLSLQYFSKAVVGHVFQSHPRQY